MNANKYAQLKGKIASSNRSSAWQKRALKHVQKEGHLSPIIRSNKVVGFETEDGAVICTKQVFETRDEARSAIEQIQAWRGSNKKPQRAYHCNYCQGYHVSSWATADSNPSKMKEEE